MPYCNVTSWFAIALAEIRTKWILREKADCKQSIDNAVTLRSGTPAVGNFSFSLLFFLVVFS